ncbi:MAG: Cof-type HAD-IIB family hydrolase [Paludibacteraceae bacterium]|nr:Cof-type HAD-IIB family hydrolase [Paludibacteraceae bacterium]
MSQYKMLVLDLDGTLTNSEKKITPKTKAALMKAQENGVIVVLASGRPTYGVRPVAEELELSRYGGYMLPFNGGQIISCKDNSTLFQQILPKEEIPLLYNLARRHGVEIMSYTEDGTCVLTENPADEWVLIEAKINSMEVKRSENFVKELSYPVTKCLIVGEPSKIAVAEEVALGEFGDRIGLFQSQPFFLECVPQGIDKALSLDRLTQMLGMSKDQVVACGDGHNDISMIEWSGLGVAMSNAQPKVLDKADFVTLSNDEDGIAHVIEKFFV